MKDFCSRFSLAILLFMACTVAHADPPPSGTAAVVNGTPISVSDVDQAAIQAEGAAQLSIMIDFVLIDQAATKAGTTVSDDEVNAEISKMKGGLAPGQSFEDELKKHNVSLFALENQIRHKLLLQKLAEQRIAIPPMTHVREILIATAPTLRGTDLHKPHSTADALAIVKQIQAQLKAGRSFSDLAAKYSEDPLTRSQGGDLGVIWNGTDGFNDAVWPSVENLQPGQVTAAPVKVRAGYLLAQVVSTRTDPIPSDKTLYSDCAARFRQHVLNPEVMDLLDQLRSQATINKYAFN